MYEDSARLVVTSGVLPDLGGIMRNRDFQAAVARYVPIRL